MYKTEEDKKLKCKKNLREKVQMQNFKIYVQKIKLKSVSLSRNQQMNLRSKKNTRRNTMKKKE